MSIFLDGSRCSLIISVFGRTNLKHAVENQYHLARVHKNNGSFALSILFALYWQILTVLIYNCLVSFCFGWQLHAKIREIIQ